MIRHRLSKYRSPIRKKKEVSTTSTYSLRHRKKEIHYNAKVQKQPKGKSFQVKEKNTKITKQKYENHDKEVNRKFNNRFSPKTKKHRYPTRKQTNNIPCETFNKATMHNNIHLNVNTSTGRRSALNGFLQHAYSVWDQTTKNVRIHKV